MFEAERIEDWIGTDVIDPEGEKVGKLEDVFAESGGAQPSVAAIKTGAFGRKHRLVPLEGAAVGRDYVRVRYDIEAVKDSPEASDDGVLSAEEASGLYSHYGLERSSSSGGPLEAATAREDRRAEAEAASKRADELEEEAERQADRASSKSQESASAKDSAEEAEQRRREALEEAERLRAEAAEREGG